MSTAYRFETPIPYSKLIKGLPDGITLAQPRNKDEILCLSDGTNFLSVGPCDEGKDTCFYRYGQNDVSEIVEKLEEKFGVSILSEHDDGFFEDEDEDEED